MYRYCKGKNPYLVPIFNLYFYIGVIPFKIQLNGKTKEYFLQEYIPHKVFCAFSHFGCLTARICNLMCPFVLLEKRTYSTVLILIYNTVTDTFSLLSVISFLFIIWKRKTACLEMVERTRLCHVSEFCAKKLETCTYIFASCITILFCAIAENTEFDYLLDINFGGQCWIGRLLIFLVSIQRGSIFIANLVILYGIFIALRHVATEFHTEMRLIVTIPRKNICHVFK